MANRKPKILFLSTGDATRSRIAHAFFRAFAGDGADVASTAVRADAVDPLAPEVMKEAGIDISGAAAKSVADSLKDQFTCVITICDAAKERHPIFPFTPRLLHWSIADPASTGGSPQQKLEQLRRVRDEIKEQVSGFISNMGKPGESGFSRAATASR